MKLVYTKYQLKLELKENIVNIVIVENSSIYTELIWDLYKQCNGEGGGFILSEENKELKIPTNIELCIDPFSIDFNNRKILNKLYQELEEIGKNYTYEKSMINSKIVTYLDKIIFQSKYNNLVSNLDIDWISLFKIYDVKLDKTYMSILEKLIEYIKILINICNISILCLVNIKSYLTDLEIQQLYEMVFYYKIKLILIESSERRYNEYEKVLIIDQDMCLIYK